LVFKIVGTCQFFDRLGQYLAFFPVLSESFYVKKKQRKKENQNNGQGKTHASIGTDHV
jgi:hypothetical protein